MGVSKPFHVRPLLGFGPHNRNTYIGKRQITRKLHPNDTGHSFQSRIVQLFLHRFADYQPNLRF